MKFYIFVWSFFALVFLISIFGLLRHKYDPIFFSKINTNVHLTGVVVDEPDQRQNSTNLVVLPEKILDKSIDKKHSEKILVRAPPNTIFQYGDEVEIDGKLQLPQKIDSENGNSFNYPEYLAKDGIYYLINRAEVKVISSGHGNFLKRQLFRIKNLFLGNLKKVLPEPHSSFAGGLIVAGKKSLPKDLLDQFQKTGTLQIVVLSGYNITIVAEAMIRFFRFLPGAGGFLAGAVSIILFSIMAGGTSTIIRAAIMALISILAKLTHRVYDARRALFLAGFLMVLQNPRILVYDPSFQLSFMATLGLMTLSPYFDRRLNFLPEKFQIRQTASATTGAQVFVTPILLYQIGQISLISVPANMLMMVIVPYIMLAGFISGLLVFISPIIALPGAFISYLALSYELFILKFFASIPFVLLKISFSFWLLIITYGFYIFIYFRKNKTEFKIKESGLPFNRRQAALTDFSEVEDIKIIENS